METCRKCSSEIEKGKGRFRTEEGLVCPDCVTKMSKRDRQKADVEAKEYASITAKKALRDAEDRAYRSAQSAIGRILFPLSGPRRELSITALDEIITVLETKDADERTLKVCTIVRDASAKIEETLQATTGADDTGDASLEAVQGGKA